MGKSKKVSATERAEALRAVYTLAEKNKGEDRITGADIKQAKKVLNYKEPKKAADYSGIKDYGELSKGGEPIKAVLGVAVLATKKGKDTLKKFLKGKKEVAAASPGMAAIPTTMNKGGGMDMGQMPNTVKPEPRGNPGIVGNVVGKGADYIKDLID